ncbi:MAG: methyltransferase domain-containing protein [Haloferacaceae archaeon]
MYLLELGGEDDAFAALEARSAASEVEVVAPGVATATGLRVDRVPSLAYTHTASRLVGRTGASVAAARALVAAAPLDAEGPVAVRARDVRNTAGVSTRAAEREVGDALVERGYAVDLEEPASVLRVAFAGETCLVGWAVAESVRDYGERRPSDRPFVQPGGMDPLDARAIVNVAGAGPDRRVLDPMCGAGGLAIEAGLVGSRVLAADAQARMARGARENLRAALDGGFEVLRADATALPLRDGACAAVAFDAPYGRQSKVVGDPGDLLAGALSEARRVAPRAVVVADSDCAAAARAAGWTVAAVHERRVHRSLVRHVHVLDR